MAGAYETGVYRNIFKECGYSEEEIEKRVKETFETIFYGSEEERFYHEAGADMGYMEDTGNHDVRTEGMSYGMMVCVQMNRKKEFDRLWKWVRTYMYIEDGPGKKLFCLVVCCRWYKKRGRTGTGWRRIFCNGALFCFKEMGRWRRHFRLQQRGKSNFTGMCP